MAYPKKLAIGSVAVSQDPHIYKSLKQETKTSNVQQTPWLAF